MRLRLALLATFLLMLIASPANAYTEGHCRFYDPLGVWDAGIHVCIRLNYRPSGDGVKGTGLRVTVPGRCHFMEHYAFTNVRVTITTRTGSVTRHLTAGGCRRYGHPQEYHRPFSIQANARKAAVRVVLKARRAGGPDSFVSIRFNICRNGSC